MYIESPLREFFRTHLPAIKLKLNRIISAVEQSKFEVKNTWYNS